MFCLAQRQVLVYRIDFDALLSMSATMESPIVVPFHHLSHYVSVGDFPGLNPGLKFFERTRADGCATNEIKLREQKQEARSEC